MVTVDSLMAFYLLITIPPSAVLHRVSRCDYGKKRRKQEWNHMIKAKDIKHKA